ncbi:asparaginase [Alicyclobacillus fastidiosus]|uniref:asparaginase n=1 Tax=Alicyclobacillus fastidiosus TaxID=392011 RepID=A0ABY6ZRW5_9BACL|nr:asparaginase [Alicyclobacillus fastidiosus]WAH44705.1 asparaginase [Alicyclobacillus fastidiosus]
MTTVETAGNSVNRIVVVNTGGTIAMERDEGKDAVSVGEDQPIHRLATLLSQYAKSEMVDLFQVPSPHMTPEMMAKLAGEIRVHLAREDVAGVVVTHGTDTLEETAYYLDLTIDSDKPVVVTGAMRSSNEVGADGPVNLVESVRVAIDPRSRGRGTLVVFNDEIHAARFVTKTHTSNVSTFQSPSYGPIGFVTSKAVSYHQPPSRSTVFTVDEQFVPQIPLVKMVAGQEAAWLNWLFDVAIDGLVVEAFGAGNVPPAVVPIIEALCARKTPVVVVSRCYNGYVQDVYGYVGGGKQLRELGCIFSNGLNGQKARIRLLVLTGAGLRKDELQAHFDF